MLQEMRVRSAALLSGIVVVLCGLWLMQTVLWPRGGTATDLRPLFPIIVAIVLVFLIWLWTILSAALDSYRRVVHRKGPESQ